MYLYLFRQPNISIWKIGISSNPKERLKQIASNGGIEKSAKIYLTVCLHTNNRAKKTENFLHKYYKKNRFFGLMGSGKTEWFKLSYPFLAVSIILFQKAVNLLLNIASIAILLWFLYAAILFFNSQF
jgi:T5orf172 domain